MAVGVVGPVAGDPRRDGAGDLRFARHRRAEAHAVRVGNGLKTDLQAAVAGGAKAQLSDQRTWGKGLGCTAGNVQDLARGQGRAAADAAELRLVVEVTLVAQAGVEKAAFALQLFVLVEGVAQLGIRFGVQIGLAVGAARPAALVHVALEPRVGLAWVVGAKVNVLLHHLVTSLQLPDGVLGAAAQAGGRSIGQFDVELIVTLGVMQLQHVDAQALVVGNAVPDPDLGQQPRDKGQVAFTELHHLLALGVLAQQVEKEVLAFEAVAAAQDALDDLRH